jgi:cytochrome o ubiquinol oxidase subunit 2
MIGVLNPAGPVGAGERIILYDSIAIMLAIVIPTMACTLFFAWRYRASNSAAKYLPDWSYSGRLEMLVWSIPALVVLFLGGIAWEGSHDLDPAARIPGQGGPRQGEPLQVQVVSLDWKWLFIYPQLHVASVNRLIIPAGVPIHFQLTSATVMNSFFIPQLGSQIYTMAGMTSDLNLLADHAGDFSGMSAQFSGDGFSDMHFVVTAMPQTQFDAWSAAAHGSPPLDAGTYAALAADHTATKAVTYGSVAASLFHDIVAMRPIAAAAPSGGRGT